jgi:hypothetical protein
MSLSVFSYAASVGYQEITDYVKANGPGAYTDIALLEEGSNTTHLFSGGWTMIVIYENPVMKSRAVTLFDGYAYVSSENLKHSQVLLQ